MQGNLALLAEPMPPEQEKRRPDGFSFFEFGDIARRIIEATGNAYSWEVVSMRSCTDAKGKDYWIVHGRLTVASLGSRDGIGTHQAQGAQDIEAIKSAETDAFKRAATKFGVALELYDKDRVKPASNGNGARSSASNGNGNGSNGAPSAGVWDGPGQCPKCHAPQGKRHSNSCGRN